MDAHLIWSAVLSIVMGGFGFFMREKVNQVKDMGEDIKRVERLLNITREEVARDYITQAEVQRITDHIDQRFNRLEAKIDQLIQQRGQQMKKVKGYEGEDGSMVSKDYGGSSGTGEYAPAPAAKKQRTVTKEELAKSGLSLRDFLNKERGLTRRSESAAPMPPPVPAEVTQTSAPAPVSAPADVTKMSANERMKQSMESNLADARSGSGKTDTRSINERIRSSSGAEAIGDLLSRAKQNYESTRPVSKQVQKEREQAAARGNLAKGGKVSSASSRGDGIAQRGKTRGKMC